MTDPTTQKHYVAPVETESIAVDAVRISEKPSNLWLDAWQDLRRRPLFWFSVVLALVFLVMAVLPKALQATPPASCDLSNSNGGPAA